MALREEENLYLLERNLDKLNTPLFVFWGKEDKVGRFYVYVTCIYITSSHMYLFCLPYFA